MSIIIIPIRMISFSAIPVRYAGFHVWLLRAFLSALFFVSSQKLREKLGALINIRLLKVPNQTALPNFPRSF